MVAAAVIDDDDFVVFDRHGQRLDQAGDCRLEVMFLV
jgi:hypothetical protein